MWGLTDIPADDDAAINAYKIAQGITNPCAGPDGGAVNAVQVAIAGQNFLGYPTYIIICPDKSMYFDVCWPPSSNTCFDPYIEDCGFLAISANFSSDATEICQYEVVTYEDMSVGNITSWNWTFEGGDPATSTEQNPMVTYNGVGIYDVELEVSDGTESNTLFIDDYVMVNECTSISEEIDKSYQIFPNPTTGEFEIQISCNGDVNIQLYNILGMKVYQYEGVSNGQFNHKLNIGDLQNGVYLVMVKTNEGSQVQKLRLIH